jgi:hypothetical protein
MGLLPLFLDPEFTVDEPEVAELLAEMKVTAA